MDNGKQVSLVTFCIYLLILFFSNAVKAENNIAFLDKEHLDRLNHGIYEIVTPKIESPKIKYAKELPFDKLSFKERNEKYYSIGTAFFISDKELMTAEHVLSLMFYSQFHNFYIRDSDGNVYPFDKVKKYSTRRDMAVFNLKKYPDKIIPLSFTNKVEIGDTVFSAGNAQGEGVIYRAGQVASFTPEAQYGKWKDIRFTSPASKGNSGGPLLNMEGKVAGVVIKKNPSENYNIAVPITEFDNLKDKAIFHIRNMSLFIEGTDDRVSSSWSFEADLPESISKLADKSQQSLMDFRGALSSKLIERSKDRFYPRGERFRDYLRSQINVNRFGQVEPTSNYAQWKVDTFSSEVIPISEEQKVTKSRFKRSTWHAVIEKPVDMPLQKFIDSPKSIMDTFLKATAIRRPVGTEQVRVVSLGEPEKVTKWTDKLGRKWQSSQWNLSFSNLFVYSHCLPHPRAVICNIDIKQSYELSLGYLKNIQQEAGEIVVGYEGEVDDWVEYFSLGEEYLPEVFKLSTFVRNGSHLKASLGGFNVDFDSEKIKGDSNIHIHMGYSNEKLLAEEVLLFEIFPQKGAKNHYRVQSFFESSPFNSDKYKSTWKDIISTSGNYSGEIVNGREEVLMIRNIDLNTEKTFSSIHDKKIKQVFATGCYYKSSDKKGLKSDCKKFNDSVSFEAL